MKKRKELVELGKQFCFKDVVLSDNHTVIISIGPHTNITEPFLRGFGSVNNLRYLNKTKVQITQMIIRAKVGILMNDPDTKINYNPPTPIAANTSITKPTTSKTQTPSSKKKKKGKDKKTKPSCLDNDLIIFQVTKTLP